MLEIRSKLPNIGTNIFTVMSSLANQYGAINLAQGFPNFDTPDELKSLVNKHLQAGANQYAPMRGTAELRNAIAQKISFSYNRTIDIDREICITSGASQAIFNAILALVPRESEVIVIEPCYDSYKPAIALAGATAVTFALEGPTFEIDWVALGKLVTDKTSMIIVNTPHNPTGTILDAADLESLHLITKDTNILILSDEVYEHLVFDNAKHLSLISHPELAKRTIAVFSFGKTYHCTGWKIGYCIAPEEIMNEFVKTHQFDIFCVPHFIQLGIAEYINDSSTYTSLSGFYQQKRDLFQTLMQESPFKALPAKGSFFQLYDYAAVSSELDMTYVKKMTQTNLVASIPISAFYSTPPARQYIRFCFAKTDETLIEAARRLRSV